MFLKVSKPQYRDPTMTILPSFPVILVQINTCQKLRLVNSLRSHQVKQTAKHIPAPQSQTYHVLYSQVYWYIGKKAYFFYFFFLVWKWINIDKLLLPSTPALQTVDYYTGKLPYHPCQPCNSRASERQGRRCPRYWHRFKKLPVARFLYSMLYKRSLYNFCFRW